MRFTISGKNLEVTDSMRKAVIDKLGKLIKESSSFQPKKFKSNTDNMINLLNDYIDSSNHISWINKYYIFFYFCLIILLVLLIFIICF